MLKSDNAFLRNYVDITNVVKPSSKIRIIFESPVDVSNARRDAYPFHVTQGGNGFFDNGASIAPNFIRKDASSWGWDWGIGLVPSGVWGEVRVVEVPVARLRQCGALVYVASDEQYAVQVTCMADVASQTSSLRLEARLVISSEQHIAASSNVDDSGVAQLTLSVPSKQVKLWWPNGLGDQPLYDVHIDLLDQSDAVDQSQVSVGFRNVQLVEPATPNDEPGRLMQFVVNGVEVFAKGANVIPVHVIQDHETPEATLTLLRAAVRANFNIVRVWGGGHYMPSHFYRQCDELGLMVWQEFAFACSEYPTDGEYLRSVSEEVRDVVARLGHHPSLVLWSGNNENLAYASQGPRNLTAYNQLYENTVRSTLALVDPWRSFWPASPSNGMLVDDPQRQLYVIRWDGDEQDPSQGDRHYYDYGPNCMNVSNLPPTRFMSEYGLQSLPSLASLVTQMKPSDLHIGSPLLQHRQHHVNGWEELNAQLRRYFASPTGKAGSIVEFDAYIYLTQLLQARCIGAWTETWRRRRDEAGYYTRGAMYWQLNDVWHAPTWSSVEFGGHEKMLHSTIRRAFAPLAVVGWLDAHAETASISFVADELPASALAKGACKLELSSHPWRGEKPTHVQTFDCQLSKHASSMIVSQPIEKVLGEGATVRSHFVRVTVYATGMPTAFSHIYPSDADPLGFQAVALPSAHITVTVPDQVKANFATVMISTDFPAVGVWLEAGGGPDHLSERMHGYWSDNSFDLVANEKRNVTFFLDDNDDAAAVDLAQLRKLLRVVHLASATAPTKKEEGVAVD